MIMYELKLFELARLINDYEEYAFTERKLDEIRLGLFAWFSYRYAGTGCEFYSVGDGSIFSQECKQFIKANSEEELLMFKLKWL